MNESKKIGFIYIVEHIGVDGKIKSVETVKNIIPTVGLNYMLEASLRNDSQMTNWYIGLYTASRTPVATDTMTTLIADCVESNNYGDTVNRSLVTFPVVASGATTTSASPNSLTFATGETVTGGFITSGITIGSNSGLLLSAVEFSSPKVLAAGEILRVPVGISLADA